MGANAVKKVLRMVAIIRSFQVVQRKGRCTAPTFHHGEEGGNFTKHKVGAAHSPTIGEEGG